jgi:hypothetical protein
MSTDQIISRLQLDIATSECELYARIVLHAQQYFRNSDISSYKAAKHLNCALDLKRKLQCQSMNTHL